MMSYTYPFIGEQHLSPMASRRVNGRCEFESLAQGGRSSYTAELLQLERSTPLVAQLVGQQLAGIRTPPMVQAWKQALVQHPEFVGYILRGISGGFRIGFDYQRYSCKPAHSDMKSATENAGVVEEYLLRELTAGRVVGPLARGSIPAIQISLFGIIPKSEPGKW